MTRRGVLVGFLVLLAGYLALQAFQDRLPPAIQQGFSAVDERIVSSLQRVRQLIPGLGGSRVPAAATGQADGRITYTSVTATPAPEWPHRTSPEATVRAIADQERPATVFLTNGGVVTGELVEETPEGVTVRWEGEEVRFGRPEIRRISRASGAVLAHPGQAPPPAVGSQVTLELHNGGTVTGELVRDVPEHVVLRWAYGDVEFPRADIRRMASASIDARDITLPWEGEHAKVRWPYHHPVVVKLMKGTVVDARITVATPERVTAIQRLDGGGSIEHVINRADLDTLEFQPLRNERSQQIEAQLRTIFPEMHWYTEGLFTIVTDSAPPTVKQYRRTVRELATDWYLTFAPLAQARAPTVQQYLVIFDDWDRYIEYALTDGQPGWVAVGYFDPADEVLYCFNMVGERFSTLLEEAYLGRFRTARDQAMEGLKGHRYEVFIEGRLSEFLQKLEAAHAAIRQTYQQLSLDTLRHELTHALFHNWQLQMVALTPLPAPDQERAKQKREFLKAQEPQKKRELLEGLFATHGAGEPPMQWQGTNPWFVEGLAGYMEPVPVSAPNAERLAEIQEARGKGQVLPLEFLDAFRVGSFRGMAIQSQLYAYAQSWALCHFLMTKHRGPFLAYLDRIATERPTPSTETLPWLLSALGRELRPLEEEFMAYLAEFPAEDPFWLKQQQHFLDLQAELDALWARLWSN